MKFHDLSLYLEELENTSSRNDITKILAKLFTESSKDEIDKIAYLILGILAPSYRGIVFNLADQMVIQAVSLSYKKSIEEIKSLYKEKGDLGDVSYHLAKAKRDLGLSVNDVYDELVKIAREEGEGSQERKIQGLSNLLSKLSSVSAKYVTRIPVGKLRLGFSDKTIIDALGFMETNDKTKSKILDEAYQVLPDVGLIAKNVKEKGIEKCVQAISPEVGVPVMPMLAQRLNSTAEMIKKMGEVSIEPKFDGVRVLIHYKKERGKDFVMAFTRNLNDVRAMFPELAGIGKYIKAKSVILDSEGVGVDPKTERIVDFQKTMSRRRVHDIGESAKATPLRFQVFDILYKDGKSYMKTPYLERRKVLESTITPNKLLVLDGYKITKDPDVIKREHKRLIDAGLEGIIAKKVDADYVPGRTGWRWVKMKEEEGSLGKLADTVDCIVMGYTKGKGKRSMFGVGQFLVGIKDGEKIKSLTKVGTGITDEQFKDLSKRLDKLKVSKVPNNYEVMKDLEPDYWVSPSLVAEIAADEITVSPRHTLGFALRFPRLVKFRDDKSVNESTKLSEIKELYKLQKS